MPKDVINAGICFCRSDHKQLRSSAAVTATFVRLLPQRFTTIGDGKAVFL